MRILAAPDKFKGSLTAQEAAEAIGAGFRRGWPGSEVEIYPMADGGEGTAEALRTAMGGTWVEFPAQDALGRAITGRYALVEQGVQGQRTAILELPDTAGMWRIQPHERQPLVGNTFGTGQAVHHAAWQSRAQRILLGLGGSATNDAGIGFAHALGWQFLDAAGIQLPPEPGRLRELERIVAPAQPLPAGVQLTAACDVNNPLLGPEGSTTVFGPQKGVTAELHPILEDGLSRLATIYHQQFGGRDDLPLAEVPGAGAAGGMGFGVMAFGGGILTPGFEMIAEAVGLDQRIAKVDLVITGEGSLDLQSLQGKTPIGVARRAQLQGKPVIAFAGRIAPELRAAAGGEFDAILGLCEEPLALADAIANAKGLLEEKCALLARLLRIGGSLGG